VDPEKVILMALFHDVPEARINDPHRIVQRYFERKDVDQRVMEEQLERVPQEVSKQIGELFSEMEEGASREAKAARDADILECLIQAREYQALGIKDVADWIRNCRAALRTDSAKKIAEACLEMEPSEWWKGLKR
jgi:putative hydrolase of HD superfamily